MLWRNPGVPGVAEPAGERPRKRGLFCWPDSRPEPRKAPAPAGTGVRQISNESDDLVSLRLHGVAPSPGPPVRLQQLRLRQYFEVPGSTGRRPRASRVVLDLPTRKVLVTPSFVSRSTCGHRRPQMLCRDAVVVPSAFAFWTAILKILHPATDAVLCRFLCYVGEDLESRV